MNEAVALSEALVHIVSTAAASVVAVHGARCETTTGVAFGKDLVVTAAHALDRERELEVTLADERRPATWIGADAASNLAVLRVEGELVTPPHGDPQSVRMGALAVALSRGARGARARLALVSRVGPEWRLAGGTRVERWIESDLPALSGLSGSALFGMQGELIGVNVAGLARGSLVTLPAASVAGITQAIAAHGRVRRARLGVGLERVELPRAHAERLGRRHGLIVLSVLESGPAERGGLLLGDVIVAVGGTPVERVEELQALLAEPAIGVEVPVTTLRAGNEQALQITPEAR
jgi:serine protease DegQ